MSVVTIESSNHGEADLTLKDLVRVLEMWIACRKEEDEPWCVCEHLRLGVVCYELVVA